MRGYLSKPKNMCINSIVMLLVEAPIVVQRHRNMIICICNLFIWKPPRFACRPIKHVYVSAKITDPKTKIVIGRLS